MLGSLTDRDKSIKRYISQYVRYKAGVKCEMSKK